MKRPVACLIVFLAAIASSPAMAGLLPPSVWQSNGRSSESVLAFRTALEKTLAPSSKAGAELNTAERNAIAAYYKSRGFAALWLTADGPRASAAELADVLRNAASHALAADTYTTAIEAFDALGANTGADQQARVEVMLTAAALVYGRHATAGQIRPRSLDELITIDPDAIDPATLLDRLTGEGAPAALLESLHPQTADYRALHSAYAAALAQAQRGGWTRVADGKALKPGMSEQRVKALRIRLAESDDLAAAPSSDDMTYDDALAEAVKVFQKRHGLDADAVVGPGTLGALNVPIEARLEQIAGNLEQRRWLADDLGTRHVFVNQADYRVRVIDSGKVIYESRAIIGKKTHQTPIFSNEIAYIEFNPYWNVPDSITTEEYLPYLVQDRTVLTRAGFETLDRSTNQPVDPQSINWREIDPEAIPYRFRQPPGGKNALGAVKFMFPNQHAVYMHDTPSRGLFSHRVRALSHGCVRVQNPIDLAEILLAPDGWSRNQIERAIADGANQPITLKHKVPVHLAYWTAWIDDSGRLNLRDDVYGRDSALAAALGLAKRALKLADLSAK